MKKPFLIIIVLICALSGCKIDEDGLPKKSSANLLGTWYIKSQITTGTAFGLPINDTSSSFTPLDYYMFNSDKTVKLSESSGLITIGTYSLSNKTLTINGTDDDGVFTVDELTANSLVLSVSVSFPELATETHATLTLARQ